MNIFKIVSAGVVVASYVVAFALYAKMPELMAGHWDARGVVNGTIPRFWGVYLMPFIATAMYALFLFIPKLDPMKQNIEKFRQHYDGFIAFLMVFIFYLYGLTLAWNLGYRFDMVLMMVPAFAVLFYDVGILVSKSEPNWFIGIRTPWTLSSPRVWKETHELGGRLFKAAAVISLVGLAFHDYAFWFMIVPVTVVGLYTVVFSYFSFQREKKSQRG